jgi:alkanesulfonate monooxygenase SsuD/methylene tetrahydromethanopterin reductase-like flavin-dependent oxidoreductase (luciferase family)
MKFGILYNIDYRAEVHGPQQDYFEGILRQTEFLEQLGYHTVWFGEHHYNGYSFGNPSLIATAAAGRTKRIRLGTGVSLVPLHHPITLAEDYATLDALSGGRLDYGVGRGYLTYAYEVLGVDLDEAVARYREGLAVIETAWASDGPFSFDGQFTKLKDYHFFPKPVQRPRPPIYSAAARTADSFAFAGTKGYHLCTALFGPDNVGVRAGVKAYHQALADHGHDPADFEIAGVTQMYCADTKQEAMRDGGRFVTNYYNFFQALRARGPGATLTEEFKVDPVELDRVGRILLGEPDELIERLEQIAEDYRITLMLFEVAHGGATDAQSRAVFEMFATRVMPHFAKKEPAKRKIMAG